jgi:HTH-type transcriptional regulator/antitoxin HigA
MNDHVFEPDWFSAPGGTILDVLEERDLSSKELASLLGYSIERTERLIAGKEAITRDVAALLAHRVGGSEKFWLSREKNYRNEVARLQSSGNATAAKAWLDELPLKDMQKFGWIPAAESSFMLGQPIPKSVHVRASAFPRPCDTIGASVYITA